MTKRVFLILFALVVSVSGATLKKKVSPKKPSVSLRGSGKVARHQNVEADKEGLSRVMSDKELKQLVRSGALIPLPDNQHIGVSSKLDSKYRYCRPWTRDFLLDFGKAHDAKFGRRLEVTSAVRTIPKQKSLQGRNGNAARVTGPTRSSHLTGSTVDILKKSLSGKEIDWLREFLRQKKLAGQVEVVEEFRQPVFHVMVFKNYGMSSKK